MADFDERTGAPIGNYESALQSVRIILFTRLGERVMLRQFGAGAIELLGRLATPRLFAAYKLLLASAIDLWEPRFRVRRVFMDGTVDAVRQGRFGLSIEVDWRPNAHLGDPTVDGVRVFSISVPEGRGRIA